MTVQIASSTKDVAVQKFHAWARRMAGLRQPPAGADEWLGKVDHNLKTLPNYERWRKYQRGAQKSESFDTYLEFLSASLKVEPALVEIPTNLEFTLAMGSDCARV
jgi:hypothetical protein